MPVPGLGSPVSSSAWWPQNCPLWGNYPNVNFSVRFRAALGSSPGFYLPGLAFECCEAEDSCGTGNTVHLEENAGLPGGLVCCSMLLPTWPTVPSTSVHLAQLDRCECCHQVWLTFVAALPFPFRRAGEREGQCPESGQGSSS